jgi:HPt (histidine-containing phosphotransfer) domain-containing protein
MKSIKKMLFLLCNLLDFSITTTNLRMMDYQFINTEYLETVTGGDKEILSEIIGIFRGQIVEIHNEMNTYLSQNDYNSLAMLAHKAKSSVAIMGMNELASLLKTFELEAKEGKNADKYAGYIERYANDTKEAVLELDKYTSKK